MIATTATAGPLPLNPERGREPVPLMYLEHFGLTQQPFRLTPAMDCFYEGAQRGRTLMALAYALVHGDGIVTVTGDIGSGKSTMARVLMSRANRKIQFVFVANPAIGPRELLEVIADDMGLGHLVDAPSAKLMRHIQKTLIALHSRGRQVVMLVDEAQAMPVETLQQIRLMTNLETSVLKLLQVVLVGQPELDQVLSLPQLRPLRERIAHKFTICPLSDADVRRYLDYRLRRVNGNPGLFEPAAVKLISRKALGLARRINLIADKCLMAAYLQGSQSVDVGHVREALADVAFQFDLGEDWSGAWKVLPRRVKGWLSTARN